MKFKVEFSGGLELLFNNQTEFTIEVNKSPFSIQDLLSLLCAKYIQKNKNLFVENDDVRPGIIVIINDTDWEILDGLDYKINDKDVISFISTIHGG